MLRLHDEEFIVSNDCFEELHRHGAVLVAADVAGHQLRIQAGENMDQCHVTALMRGKHIEQHMRLTVLIMSCRALVFAVSPEK